ncbi:FKBP-type peptidyl-prolyl cis-trans isomerase [Atopomonas hussainii]|uniref:FKBP-type peptidyl-prolyl cis-trans isomerase n=1 Tax=Atopomonas hussainii TaxID=1429083 RepID=UPI00090040BE|nr:FKBP-type peptidyl-prolyl cis-trans isomerase [Atopomonas hussainii]
MRVPVACALLFSFSLPVAAEEPQDPLAYSLGVKLGERLRDEVPGLALDDLAAGLRAAYQGAPLALEPATIERLLAEQEAAQGDSSAASERLKRKEAAFIAEYKAKYPNAKVLDGGVVVRELSQGRGAKPKADATVSVRYKGLLADGSVFDESAEAVRFSLNSLIPGWRTALAAMPEGSHWEILVPSAQAYGAEGAGEVIPPYAPLVFDLLLEKAH